MEKCRGEIPEQLGSTQLQNNNLSTPFEYVLRWPRHNTFVIPPVSDHNMLVDDRFIKIQMHNLRPFEKY